MSTIEPCSVEKLMSELIQEHSGFLKFYAFKTCRGRLEKAEDLYQDAMLKLLLKPESYNESKGKFTTFGARVILNLSIDQNRLMKNKTFNEYNTVDVEALSNNHLDDQEFSLDYLIETTINEGAYVQDVKFIMDRINELKPKYSEVLHKRILGHGNIQIAEILEMDVANVKSRIHRAKKMLRAKLNLEWDDILI